MSRAVAGGGTCYSERMVMVIYLDNAATTFPKPAAVMTAVMRFMSERAANPGRSGHALSMKAAETVYRCRESAARFFHAPGPENVAFCLNATQAINTALKGCGLAGKAVVTSTVEHNAVMRPLHKLAGQGVVCRTADIADGDDAIVENFRRALTPQTAMIACTHASNVTGRVLPIGRLGALCKEKGLLFLVDASQSAGVLPIDMEAMHIDYLCMPGHKGLYGPMGTGLLIAADGTELDTLLEGGTGSDSLRLEQPAYLPDRLESGTVNAPGIAGLGAGLSYVARRGVENIYREEHALALRLYDLLADIPNVNLYTPRPETGYVPVVSFNIEGMTSVEAASALDKAGFALRGGLHCCPAAHRRYGTLETGMVRASFGAFNTARDAALLAAAIRRLAAQKADRA